jgi:hypothetical protein
MPLLLEIVTPDARVYSDTIDTVVVPTVEGEVGILPGHIPLLTQVEHGELRVTKGNATFFLAVIPACNSRLRGAVVRRIGPRTKRGPRPFPCAMTETESQLG